METSVTNDKDSRGRRNSSRLCRDLGYPWAESSSELLSPCAGQSQREEARFIHELSPTSVPHEGSNLEAKLEQMCLSPRGADK